jgi:AraC family transcriptional regulator of adaptative response / DNA-3-methyladenine glycosylase II
MTGMELERERCYRALSARDARFDGRFFVGVKTTGVYCRPVCPARTPKLQNVLFFPCAAAAAEAGFRPCRRCRPETSPGTPAWLGTSATVSRALRLIQQGALDGAGVEQLAERMGVGARHLRRLFLRHLGASPIAVAQTRRVHFARRLLDETSLPIAGVAHAAGFSSLRRFNAAVRAAYGRPPSELRRARAEAPEPGNGAELSLRLPYRAPFDWDGIVDFLQARAIPGVEAVDRAAYRRSVALDGVEGVIEVRPAPGRSHLCLRVGSALAPQLIRVVERVRSIFDLGADPHEIASHLAGNPELAPLVAKHPGVRVPGAWDGWELAVRAILGQQVSVRGATTLAGRLVLAHGERLRRAAAEGVSRLFPSAEALSRVDLTSIGLPRTRAHAIQALARALSAGELALDGSVGLDQTLERLMALPGVGAWTAGYIAMRALREPDAFPDTDLGLRKAAAAGRELLSARELQARAETWRPWRAYAAMLLWQSGGLRAT